MNLGERIRNNPFFLKYPILKQFIKFCLVGFSNTVIDFLVYLILTRFFLIYFIIANIFSFLIAATWSFILNKYWTFRNKEKRIKSQYIKFLIISTLGLILNTFFLYILVSYWGFYDLLAKAIAIIIVLFWNFGMNRFWTFRG